MMSSPVKCVPASMSSRRSVTMLITNQTNNYTLTDPEVHLDDSVDTLAPPQSTVTPMESGVCSFINSSNTAACTGYLLYQLDNKENDCKEVLVIWFFVPLDNNCNMFLVGIFENGCDKNLFEEMYKCNDPRVTRKKAGSEINHKGKVLSIKANMLDLANTTLTVKLYTAPV